MIKIVYLAITILCLIASLKGISSIAYGILERGLGGVNYGALIPIPIGIWSFIRWKKAN